MLTIIICAKSLGQLPDLIDEAVNIGKGANSIIGMVHHYLATHTLGETSLHQLLRTE